METLLRKLNNDLFKDDVAANFDQNDIKESSVAGPISFLFEEIIVLFYA